MQTYVTLTSFNIAHLDFLRRIYRTNTCCEQDFNDFYSEQPFYGEPPFDEVQTTSEKPFLPLTSALRL